MSEQISHLSYLLCDIQHLIDLKQNAFFLTALITEWVLLNTKHYDDKFNNFMQLGIGS